MGTNGLLIVLLASFLLQPEEYGLLFLALAVIGVSQVIADLGVARSAARYVAEYKETTPSQVPHILTVSLQFKVILIAIVCSGLILGRNHIATILGEPLLGPALLLGAAYLSFRSMRSFFVTVFQGFNRVEFSAFVAITENITRIGLVVAFVGLGWGVSGALIGYTMSSALAVCVGVVILFKISQNYERAKTIENTLQRRILEYSIPLTASESANVIDRRVDILLVGFFLNPVAVAWYTLSKQITEFVEAPAGSVGFALSPMYGEEKANDRLDHAAKVYELSLNYVLLLYIPAAVGLAIVAEPAILVIFGNEYAGAIPVLQVFSLFVLFKAVDDITTQSIDYLGRARQRAIAKAVTTIANVGLNLLLIPTVGVVGAAIATVVTFGLYTIANVYIMTCALPLQWRSISRTFSIVTVISGVMGGCVYFLASHATDVLSLAGVVVIGVLVWLLLVTASGLLDVEKATSALM